MNFGASEEGSLNHLVSQMVLEVCASWRGVVLTAQKAAAAKGDFGELSPRVGLLLV